MKPNYRPLLWGLALLFAACGGQPKPPADPAVAQAAPATARFLFLSDIHLDLNSKTSSYGSDTGTELWAALQGKIAQLWKSPNPPAFVVYTGDLPAHYCCDNTKCSPQQACSSAIAGPLRTSHDANIAAVLAYLHKMLPAGTPLFYAPGNNDSRDGDYFPYEDASGQPPYSLAPGDGYPAVNAAAVGSAAPCMVSNPHPEYGYYAAKPVDGLQVIALNTVLLGNKYYGTGQVAAGDTMLAWLGRQLASLGTDKCYIAMHIAPNQWKAGTTWQQAFLGLVSRYSDRIAGILYGHTHMDELMLLEGTQGGKATLEAAFSCPGITPQHTNNPGFKTVSYDPATFEIIDFETHWTLPGDQAWSSNSYTLSGAMGLKTPPVSILSTLQPGGKLDTVAILAMMRTIYCVKNASCDMSYFPQSIVLKAN